MDDFLKKNPYEDRATSELIDDIIRGDDKAMIFLLVVKCGQHFNKLCNKYPQLSMTAEDLAQEVMINLYKNDYKALKDFKGANKEGKSCKLTTYVSTIAVNIMKSLSGGKNKTHLMKEPKVFETLTIGKEILNIKDEGISEFSELETFEALLIDLSESDRLVFTEYTLKDVPAKDVAEKLGISVAALHTRASRLCDALVKKRISE